MEIPIIAKSNETSTTGTVGPHGAVEPGPCGPLVMWTWWSSGTLDQVVLVVFWSCGPGGPLVLWSRWSSGPLVLVVLWTWWSSGPVDLVVLWYCH